MGWADMAIAAAGTTTWELAYMGVPTLFVVLADNQEAIAAGMAADGICVDLGWYSALRPKVLAREIELLRADSSAREAMGRLGRARVDGRGARRVVNAMRGEST